MSIELGWWCLPLALTIMFFVVANRYEKPTHGNYINIDFEGIYRSAAALIASLVVWLVYAFAT